MWLWACQHWTKWGDTRCFPSRNHNLSHQLWAECDVWGASGWKLQVLSSQVGELRWRIWRCMWGRLVECTFCLLATTSQTSLISPTHSPVCFCLFRNTNKPLHTLLNTDVVHECRFRHSIIVIWCNLQVSYQAYSTSPNIQGWSDQSPGKQEITNLEGLHPLLTRSE